MRFMILLDRPAVCRERRDAAVSRKAAVMVRRTSRARSSRGQDQAHATGQRPTAQRREPTHGQRTTGGTRTHVRTKTDTRAKGEAHENSHGAHAGRDDVDADNAGDAYGEKPAARIEIARDVASGHATFRTRRRDSRTGANSSQRCTCRTTSASLRQPEGGDDRYPDGFTARNDVAAIRCRSVRRFSR